MVTYTSSFYPYFIRQLVKNGLLPSVLSDHPLNRVYVDWKVRENHIKITKSLESQGKSGNFFSQIFEMKSRNSYD